MTRSLWIVAAVSVCLSGCGTDHDDIYAQVLAVQQDINKHLEAVVSGESPATAAKKIAGAVNRLRELESEAEKLGPPTAKADSELADEYKEKFAAARKRMQELITELKAKDEAKYLELQTELTRLKVD